MQPLTARKYGDQGNQIRRLWNNAIVLGDLLAYPTPCIGEEQVVMKAPKNNLTLHKGPPFMISDESANYIIEFY
jgi:hypothetical protein